MTMVTTLYMYHDNHKNILFRRVMVLFLGCPMICRHVYAYNHALKIVTQSTCRGRGLLNARAESLIAHAQNADVYQY